MSEPFLVGLDVGTSACKAVLVTAGGQERTRAVRPTPWRPTAHGPELDSDAVAEVARRLVEQVSVGLAQGAVRGIGVTSIAESGFPIDAAGRAQRPAVAWHDARAGDDATRLTEELPDLAQRTGIVRTERTSAVTQRWWMRATGLGPSGLRWENVAEHTVRRLGGAPLPERSLASRTGWYDVDRATWWTDALEWSGLDAAEALPAVGAGTPSGVAQADPAVDGAVLTVAGHDHLCAAVGAGALDGADVVDSCGSAEVLLRAVDDPLPAGLAEAALAAGFTTGWHVLPGRRALIGGFPSGTRLQTALRALGYTDPAEADAAAAPGGEARPLPLAELDRELARWAEGASGSPAEEAAAWRQVTASIAAHAGERHRALVELTGPVRSVLVVGGGGGGATIAAARARWLPNARWPRVEEAAARGAALFAGLAAGIYPSTAAFPRPTHWPGPPGSDPEERAT